MSKISSSPFNNSTSDERRSSTKSSKVFEREFTTKNYFCHYLRINNKSQQNFQVKKFYIGKKFIDLILKTRFLN